MDNTFNYIYGGAGGAGAVNGGNGGDGGNSHVFYLTGDNYNVSISGSFIEFIYAGAGGFIKFFISLYI